MSLGIMGVGVGISAIGLGITINSANDPLGDGPSGGLAILAGSVVLIVGALINLPKVKTKLKPAIKRYNGLANENSKVISMQLIPASDGIGLGIGIRLNK